MADRDKRKRRSYSTAVKRRVVAEKLEPGASVAAVAQRHGLNANMVFPWRRDPRFGPGQDAAIRVRQGDPLCAIADEKRLRPYLDHDVLEINNNAAERAMRPAALDRKYAQPPIMRS